MNEFVEECRSEWRRLGVPDPVADEMADELAADLEEAEAEGASAEEVLGSGAFEPRSFAAAWAAERGVVRRPLPSGRRLSRSARLPAAVVGAFALIAIIGAALVIHDARSDSGTLALPAPPASSPRVLRLVAPRPAQGIWLVAPNAGDPGGDAGTVGSLLLVLGLAGIVPLAVFWSLVGRDRWTRGRATLDDRPRARGY